MREAAKGGKKIEIQLRLEGFSSKILTFSSKYLAIIIRYSITSLYIIILIGKIQR